MTYFDMRFVRNVSTLLRHPVLFREYLAFQRSRVTHKSEAVRTFPDGTRIGGVNGFSEFHALGTFVTDHEQNYFRSADLSAGTIFDVGANLGIVTCLLARRFPSARVDAFEPNPSSYRALTRNVELNGCTNIHARQVAVSDHSGTVLFSAHPHSRGTASITTAGDDYTSEVPCTTIDSYVRRENIGSVAFLKVDVEGYEELVFRGAENLLQSRAVSEIYYEVCPANCDRSGLDPAKPTQMLLDSGYRVFRFNLDGQLIAASLADVSATVLENWVALAP